MMDRPSRTYTVANLDELAVVTKAILALCVTQREQEETAGATVLALRGDLGAGKTTVVQQLARQLGVTEVVTSPTFVVMKQYETTNETFPNLIHIDAYRIETIDEMRPLGFAEILTEPQTLICIEWAERLWPLLPSHTLTLDLVSTIDGVRTVTFTYGH